MAWPFRLLGPCGAVMSRSPDYIDFENGPECERGSLVDQNNYSDPIDNPRSLSDLDINLLQI